jgi:hypothetical protein
MFPGAAGKLDSESEHFHKMPEGLVAPVCSSHLVLTICKQVHMQFEPMGCIWSIGDFFYFLHKQIMQTANMYVYYIMVNIGQRYVQQTGKRSKKN